MKELVEEEEALKAYKGSVPPSDVLEAAKKDGFSDRYLSRHYRRMGGRSRKRYGGRGILLLVL